MKTELKLGLSWSIALILITTSLLTRPAREQVAGVITDNLGKVVGIVMPHHQLAESLSLPLFDSLADQLVDAEYLIVLSPDHYQTNGALATTASSLPGIMVASDQVHQLTQSVAFVIDSPEDLEKEHGVIVPAKQLQHAFPDLPILPLALSPNYQETQLQLLIDSLSALPGSTVVVLSSDFSHNQSVEVAYERHRIMADLFESMESETVLGFNDGYTDAPVPAKVLMELMKSKKVHQFIVQDEGHSGLLLGDPGAIGTSYLLGTYHLAP